MTPTTHVQRLRPLFITAVLLFGSTGVAQESTESRLVVTTDARIELLAAVQSLSSYDERTNLITRFDHGYKHRMLTWFGEFAGHDAVLMFDELSRRGFSFDGPPATLLHFGEPPELEPRIELEPDLLRRIQDQPTLDRFMVALRDFARQSDFLDFYETEQPFYESIIAGVEAQTKNIDVDMLERYYGTQQAGYTIILAPMFHPGGFGPRIKRDDNAFEIFSVTGPQGMKDDVPTFGTEEDFRYLVWHEFSHSFVNPAVDAHGDAVDQYAALFKPMADVMRRQAYNNWRTCVYEHVVRAATCRFAFLHDGDDAGSRALRYEQSRGFNYIEPLSAKLAEYEQRRDEFPTFESFFPHLLTVFEDGMSDLAAAPTVEWTTPETGPVNVDPGLAEIVVQFSQPMQPEGFSFVQQSEETFPEVAGQVHWRTERICVLPMKLKPATRYWIGLNSGRFRSFTNADGVAAKTHILEFTTADE